MQEKQTTNTETRSKKIFNQNSKDSSGGLHQLLQIFFIFKILVTCRRRIPYKMVDQARDVSMTLARHPSQRNGFNDRLFERAPAASAMG